MQTVAAAVAPSIDLQAEPRSRMLWKSSFKAGLGRGRIYARTHQGQNLNTLCDPPRRTVVQHHHLKKYLLQNYMLSILFMCYKKSSKAEKETCVGLPLYWHMNSLSKNM